MGIFRHQFVDANNEPADSPIEPRHHPWPSFRNFAYDPRNAARIKSHSSCSVEYSKNYGVTSTVSNHSRCIILLYHVKCDKSLISHYVDLNYPKKDCVVSMINSIDIRRLLCMEFDKSRIQMELWQSIKMLLDTSKQKLRVGLDSSLWLVSPRLALSKSLWL